MLPSRFTRQRGRTTTEAVKRLHKTINYWTYIPKSIINFIANK